MLSVGGGGRVLAGGAEVDVLTVDDGSDDVVGTVDGDDDVRVTLAEALVVVAGLDGGGVEVTAVRAGPGAPVSVLVEVLVAPVAGVSGRTFR